MASKHPGSIAHWSCPDTGIFKLINSPICPSCGNKPETITHYLMYCENHINHRRQLKHSLGRDQSLGLEILGDGKRMKDLMHFINKTRRFRESHGDLHPGPEEEEEDEEDGQ